MFPMKNRLIGIIDAILPGFPGKVLFFWDEGRYSNYMAGVYVWLEWKKEENEI
jgi:hypothetical protein